MGSRGSWLAGGAPARRGREGLRVGGGEMRRWLRM